MSDESEDAASSLEDSDDLDDIPLSMARNGRYERDEPPPTSRGIPSGFARGGFGFHLNLPVPEADELPAPVSNGLQAMRSEPVYLPETSRPRAPPGLALGLGQGRIAATSFTGAAEESSGPMPSRTMSLKPPMLNLINPASASPVPSGAPTPAMAAPTVGPACGRNAWGPPTEGQHGPVRVDLVSTAFLLQDVRQPGRRRSRHRDNDDDDDDDDDDRGCGRPSTSERITERCCIQLGIAPCDLTFYELRPLENGIIPDSCSRVGVEIRGSTFSLSALEDMLARSKRDEQLATMLDRVLQDSSAKDAEAKLNAERLAKQNEEIAVLRERLQAEKVANQHLREQLQRSDDHRQLLGSTIRTIKKEFEDFKSRVVVEGTVDHLPLHQLSLGHGQGQGPSQASAAAASAAAAAAAAGLQPLTGPGTGGGRDGSARR